MPVLMPLLGILQTVPAPMFMPIPQAMPMPMPMLMSMPLPMSMPMCATWRTGGQACLLMRVLGIPQAAPLSAHTDAHARARARAHACAHVHAASHAHAHTHAVVVSAGPGAGRRGAACTPPLLPAALHGKQEGQATWVRALAEMHPGP